MRKEMTMTSAGIARAQLRRRMFALPIVPNTSPLTEIVSPNPGDPNDVHGIGWDRTDHVLIKVIFSDPVDTRTVTSDSVVLSSYHGGIVLPTTLTWEPSAERFLLVSDEPVDFERFGGWLVLTLSDQIRDTRGFHIDGNFDGIEGGDYVLPFTIPFV